VRPATIACLDTDGLAPATAEPRISAVIPAWNRSRTVGRAIESALAQSHRPHQIVVVDDGSVDETPAVVAGFGDAVRYIRQDNQGASAARNRGVAASSAEWVAFLDSDDIWTPDHLARMAAAIRHTSGRAGLYFSDTQQAPEDSTRTIWEQGDGFRIDGAMLVREDGTEWGLCDYQPMMLQSSVIRRSDYLEVGGLWEVLRTREDTHLFCRLSIGRTVCAVSGIGAVMSAADARSRLSTICGTTTETYWHASRLMWGDVLARYPALDGRYRTRLRHRLGTSFLRLARLAAARRDWPDSTRALLRAAVLNPADLIAAVGRRL
jgi:glycosyltransferase involved in cell wall biosynthesis